MPSQYSVIDNKPIDQWKVIELREELRRRNLVTKGLKEELVKRLDEAIKKELESEIKKESDNGDEHILDPQNDTREEDLSLEATDDTQTTLEEDSITEKDAAIVNISHGVLDVNPGHETQNGDAIEVGERDGIIRDLVGSAPGNQNFTGLSSMQGEDDDSEKFNESNSPLVLIDEKASTGDLEGSALVNQGITVQSDTQCVDANCKEMFEESKISIVGTDAKEATSCDLEGSALVKQNITVQSDTQGVDSDLKEIFKESKTPTVRTDEKAATAGDFEGSAPFNQNTALSSTQGEDAVPREKFEESKPLIVKSTVIQSEQTNQVSEVSQDLGFQVKYKSNSTDSVSFNEMNYIKDNLTTDHFSLEPVVKQDVVQPSSSSFSAGGGHSCMVVDEQEAANDHATDEQEAVKDHATDEEDTAKDHAADEEDTAKDHATDEEDTAKDHATDEKEAAKDHATDEQEGFEHQDLGFQVKYKSNSTDSVSFNEKNYIKDNLTSDHFPLDLVVKQYVVQPSSSSCPAVGGHSCMVVDEQETAKDHGTDEQEAAKDHTTDEHEGFEHQVLGGQEIVQNLLLDKEEINTGYAANEQYVESMVEDHPSLDDNDLQNASSIEALKKEDCVESGSPEKLNLDRSSGDESMEEDILDIKHMEADIKSEEPTSKIDANMSDFKLEERATGVGKSCSNMKEIGVEDMKHASLTEKRKLEDDAEVVVNNGAPKRHRRWNPDIIKVPEQHTPLHDISMAPKNNLQPTPRRTFSRSNSTISTDSPKERIVPTPKKPATTSLRIDNFLRPFTLKAVQELLGKTGRVCDFWMDHIKTHCFVTFSSVEEATETRNAVYNLQWPPNGGRFLAADFVDPQEVKLRLAAAAPPPSLPAISFSQATLPAPPSQQTHVPQPTHHQNLRTQPQAPSQQTLAPQPTPQQNLRAQLPPPPPLSGHLPPPPSLPLPSMDGLARERLPPPPPKKPEPPVLTLDDLFKKTRATPRIYYLPLTEEQASAKLAAQQSKRTQL